MSAATVLVVDDDPVILQLLKVNFEIEGYRVLTALDGDGALTTAAVDPPDVVVLDVMMPGMSGLEVAIRFRSGDYRPAHDSVASTNEAGVSTYGAGTSLTPPAILLLSAKAQGADITAGLDVADDYVTKPFDSLDLLGRVASLVDARRAVPGSSPA